MTQPAASIDDGSFEPGSSRGSGGLRAEGRCALDWSGPLTSDGDWPGRGGNAETRPPFGGSRLGGRRSCAPPPQAFEGRDQFGPRTPDRDRRRDMKPRPAKPTTSIAHVESSGAVAAEKGIAETEAAALGVLGVSRKP